MTEDQKEIYKKLSEKFKVDDIEWVIVSAYDYNSKNGYVIKAFATPYIKKESAEHRLDTVIGPFNWKNKFELLPGEKVRFTIKIRQNQESDWIEKSEGATLDTRERGQFTLTALESALAFAEKRVLSKIGIGRYLKLVPQIGVEVSNSWQPEWNSYQFKSKVKKQNGKPEYIKFYWKEPVLPSDALHQEEKHLGVENKTQANPQSVPAEKKPASKKMLEDIEAYFMHLQNPDEADEWQPYIYKEVTDEETGEIRIVQRNLSLNAAQKILNKMEQKYGKLINNVPESVKKK